MSSTVTWIVGATSGVGRSSALALAASDRTLVLSGRRASVLEEVCASVRERGGTAVAVPMDAADAASTAAALERIASEHGTITEAVFCAGLNVAKRHWDQLEIAEFQAVVETNLTSVARGISGILPGMREAGGGRVVVISSWAGWTYGRGAGVAYSASKTALRPLTESLNDQESANGISASLICPGDIDTEFVDKRPTVPDAAARSRMLTPDDVARAVRFVLDSPREVCINELVVSPVNSHSYGK
ncbi:NADP-dependent 3-hydroxy acid dehydrogenase YdfG [Paramicrobacterium humi]|uniref:NADP-dependent 3-hydroxy acid dehydrogenase YdfG n=1 Tax=Paramicrobacterium humi TaxID=640635 RepID=A0A1H4JID5_9MICO|nr:SDR family oxidoreductase [Microbacterium humi]SEB46089.1 NADP-dependent 3-hydroxy acid dehydrogenase YdfG [Microbacterium humi]